MHGVWRASRATLLLVAGLPADTHLPGGQETALTLNADAPKAAASPDLLEFAPMDPDCVLANGLFRSVPKGHRKRSLEVDYSPGEDLRVRFVGPYLLGADDMRVLQGLMALAARQSVDGELRWIELREPEDRIGEQMVLGFQAAGGLRRYGFAAQVTGSLAMLARAIGLDPLAGGTIKGIQQSLFRLGSVTVWLSGSSHSEPFRLTGNIQLLSVITAESSDPGGPGSLRAAVNPRLASIALAGVGSAPEKYIRIDLREVRALGSDPARLVHQRLCGWIDPGECGRVKLETVVAYVWPGTAPSPRSAKWRRMRARSALLELERLDKPWTVAQYGPGKYDVARPPYR